MKNTKMTFGVAAAACLLASPAFAAKTALDDGSLSKVTGKADNTFTFGNTTSANTTVSNSADTSANIAFGWFQWNDHHGTDTSDHKGANDQSGATSAVQQSAVAQVNGLVWGAVGQNLLTNGNTVTLTAGPETNMSYGVFAAGGF